ncbi:MAG: type II toxin-antitoxin system RelE/ParE family toxin [Acidobacteria bacterium]|nr:type II toxin-antitoxin system RelE/ParE family toxin [Acidobacteriota bacterium]
MIRWTPAALRDLETLHACIADDDPRAAANTAEAIISGIEMLKLHPDLGRKGRVPGTRELIVSPYVIAYRARKPDIEVLAIIHSARRWPDEF